MGKQYELDIVIPVYNEGENIREVLDSLKENVRTPVRVLVCYDQDNDDTLPVVRDYAQTSPFDIVPVKNKGTGVHAAVMSGFAYSDAEAVLVMPADDDYNAGIIDLMFEKFRQGSQIVSASRFIRGGCMQGCPLLKSLLVRASSCTLHWLSGVASHDATNGFRLFSRRVIDQIPVESTQGFTYSLELLVKAHRRGWFINEVPAFWFERQKGTSRFRLVQWLPYYLRWYFYGIATRFIHLVCVKRK